MRRTNLNKSKKSKKSVRSKVNPTPDRSPRHLSSADGSSPPGSSGTVGAKRPATGSIDSVNKRLKHVGSTAPAKSVSTIVGPTAPITGTPESTSAAGAPTTLQRRRHLDLPAGAIVKLKPDVKLKDGLVEQLQISSAQRTPSPFGSRMGDHTISWASLVDALHARIIDRPLTEAIANVLQAQEQAQKWMEEKDSVGMRLLDALEDREQRVPRLEDAAKQAMDFLEKAKTLAAADPASPEALQEFKSGIAQHLAFLNYLPFATIPAASERGSQGSVEGTSRGGIVAEERRQIRSQQERKAASDDVTPLDPDQARKLGNELWDMFDIKAAVRASRAKALLDPAVSSKVKEWADKINNLKKRLMDEMDAQYEYAQSPADAEAIKKEALTLYKDSAKVSSGISDAAKVIQAAADSLIKNSMERPSTRQGEIDMHRELVDEAADTAQKAADEFTAQTVASRHIPPLVLAQLLHKHQRIMAESYPRAVLASGFLKPTSREAAIERLRAALEEEIESEETRKQILDQVSARYDTIKPTPEPAPGTDWTRHVKQSSLVVSYNPTTRELSVNGRPTAPDGVAGQGSHITSWRTEVNALKRTVANATSDQDALNKLKEAVLNDLKSGVMALDQYLPADQLQKSQLKNLFTAAYETRTATEIIPAASAYLQFRNLLPFATVDAGSRDTHGEGSTNLAVGHLDKQSLEEAAELQQDALGDEDQRTDIINALNAAAAELDEVNWGEKLNDRASSSSDRLRALAKKLTPPEPPAGSTSKQSIPAPPANVQDTIIDARTKEHKKVSKLAGLT